MRKYASLAVPAAVLSALFGAGKAHALIVGLASCGIFCTANNRLANGRVNFPGNDACMALCRAMAACNTFTWAQCTTLCGDATKNGGFIGYYGGTVPCVAACTLMFP